MSWSKKTFLVSFALFFLSFPSFFLNAQSIFGQANFSFTPEIYFVTRQREGGTKQSGMAYGIRSGYHRLEAGHFYYALDGLYSRGNLKGKNLVATLQSELTNSSLETRFGYTFYSCFLPKVTFTPFIGIGYLWEYYDYKAPSPIEVEFDNSFPYLPFGGLLCYHFNSSISIAAKLTARFLWDGKQTVKDPSYGKLTQCYEERMQYRAELPISYLYCWKNHLLSFSFTSFYEYRCYGSSVNFPYDFLQTELNFYGINFGLSCRF